MLYICATPIGNLADISLRAIETLSKADIILCEDTRNSKHLLAHHGISYKKLIALHQHNENEIAEKVLNYLQEGLVVVQISDAGTPGISDPGARLCNQVLASGHPVSPIPGACAYTSLLSVSGLDKPSLFYGFLPSTRSARQAILKEWQRSNYAVVIYESPHRIIECLEDIVNVLGISRKIVMGRELTKHFETIKRLQADELLNFVKNDHNQQKGEFVLLIYPDDISSTADDLLNHEQIKVLELLLPEMPPKKAVLITHKLTGANKDLLYNYAITYPK